MLDIKLIRENPELIKKTAKETAKNENPERIIKQIKYLIPVILFLTQQSSHLKFFSNMRKNTIS